jgi:VCBS repeat-containing protein
VTDVNEAPTGVSLTNATTSLPENSDTATRTKVADIVVTDDALGSESITLSGVDAASFEVDGLALYLKSGVGLDFETQASYAVTVNVTDASLAGSTPVTVGFTLTVTDVNEIPTDIALSVNTVAENAPTGTTIGTLSTTDVDAGDTFTYSLVSGTGDADNAAFTIDGSTLKTAASFNFETKSGYTVRVRSTDANGLFTEKAFVISVTDANEPATIGLPAPFQNEVAEDVAVDGNGFLSTTGQFTVVDPDAGESTFDTTVTAPAGQSTLGQLTVTPDGTFVYKVLNSLAAVQAIRAGEIVTDSFTIRSADGTSRVVSFRIAGASDIHSGAVADGYLRNARVFADANSNGALDWTDGGSLNGSWDLGEGEAWTTTDATGNFSFDFGSLTATLVTIGGVDISTNLPFVGSLRAPAGSTIINPLTTLVTATLASAPDLSVAQAATAVAAALGLPQAVDLTTYDPLARPAGDTTAIVVQKAAAGVASVIVATATNGIDTDAALANLADLVTAPNPAPVDLQDPMILASVLTVQAGGQATPPPATLVSGLVMVNATIANSQSLTEIAQTQTLVQSGTRFTTPALTSAVTAGFAARTPGSFQFVASGYPAPSFSVSGALPAGLTLTSDGRLSGTPAAGTAGTYAYTVTAANGIGEPATQAFTLTIAQSDDVVVTVDQNDNVLLSLSPRGATITDLHTAYDARRKTLTITAAGDGTMSGEGSGISVNAAARTVTVRLDVFTTFAGIVVAGSSGTDSVTIGRQGVNLAVVKVGGVDQAFVVNTGTGVGDRLVIGGPVTTKGTGNAHFTVAGDRGIALAAPVRTPGGWQGYTGDVTLATNASLTAGGAITFGAAVDGRRNLVLDAAGSVAFVGAVGATNPLTGLTISRAAAAAFADGLALDGTGTAAGTNGLTIGRGVNNVVFSSLGSGQRTIQDFSGTGIRFLGGSTESVLTGIVSRRNGTGLAVGAGNYTGTRAQDNTFDGNLRRGVSLHNATGFLLGGTGANTGNRIINSTAWKAYATGIEARGNSAGTLVQGNTIAGNAGHGVVLVSARGITVGGSTPGGGNAIRDNLGFGLVATGVSGRLLVQGNTMIGNRMGTMNAKAAKGPRVIMDASADATHDARRSS